ncbi:dnaJ homolog subfamily B member 14-like [Musca vetustissima]|uniref:dnaJ homolog subfamily B member 14-like n=1 Tax=Musca vetustissima TaxID=27455 RepID=UPI002AB74F3B|nr:dnaJ homolog subfamily B member 14-like [Musca vetustissima]
MPITEADRDKAERLFYMAQEAMRNDDLEKAEEYLLEANELCPTEYVTGSIAIIRERRTSVVPSNAEPPEYTTEDLEAVNRINNSNDFYEILGVTKTATDAEIKDAYKRLALQVHTDKNRAPGSLQAFQLLRNAADILGDPEKRKLYDARRKKEEEEATVNSTARRKKEENEATVNFTKQHQVEKSDNSLISNPWVWIGGTIAFLSVGYLLARSFDSKPAEGDRSNRSGAGSNMRNGTTSCNATKK